MYRIYGYITKTSRNALIIADQVPGRKLATAIADLAVNDGYARAQVCKFEPSRPNGLIEYDTHDPGDKRCPECGWLERSCQGRCTDHSSGG